MEAMEVDRDLRVSPEKGRTKTRVKGAVNKRKRSVQRQVEKGAQASETESTGDKDSNG